MISVQEADKLISKIDLPLKIEGVELESALHRVLAIDVIADRDFPPFDRVTMDGIALQFNSIHQKEIPIENIAPAGHKQVKLVDSNACIEVMTGAPMPINTDTIIPYERVKISNRVASIIEVDTVKKGRFIHLKGSDESIGSVLLKANKKITAADIAVLATVGCAKVSVIKKPTFAIISTGDELVSIEEAPLPHQIRSSNVHMLQAALQSLDIEANIFHIKDDETILFDNLSAILDSHQVLILSGGVSMGKFDFLPKVFEKLGVKKVFHRVFQKPGKPIYVGQRNQQVIFALPGNPISAYVCFHRYVKIWLLSKMAIKNKQQFVQLKSTVSFNKPLTYFLQVAVSTNNKGEVIATPNHGNGSGDLVNLIKSDGVIELPADQNIFEAGSVWPYYSFK